MPSFLKTQLVLSLICLSLSAQAADIWVSPSGSDDHPGTQAQPMGTILMAQRKARNLRRLHDPSVRQGINIILKGGTYPLNEPLRFRPEDAGSPNSPTIIKAASGEKPILSGGVPVTGWHKVSTPIPNLPETAQGHVWVSDAPRPAGRLLEFRQMWVNNHKAVRASTLDNAPLPRILSVDKAKEALWIPTPQVTIRNIGAMELVIHQWWAIAILRVKALDVHGDKASVTFWQPESRIEFEHPWPPPFIDRDHSKNGNSAFYLANAIEFLDHPGEWFENLQTGKLYYWPRPQEDLTTAHVVVPALKTLVHVQGTLDHPVAYLQFQGIGFEHTTWLRPSRAGNVPLQAGMPILDAYKLCPPGTPDKKSLENQAWLDRPAAGVTVKNVHHLRFEHCGFEHMASAGLDFISGTHDDVVEGCLIRDIGGNGLQMGFFGDAAFEAHLPYNPTDARVVCHNERIDNNLITDCTNEDWGGVGIIVGFAHDITITHNEVSHLNYSGISVGWSWSATQSCVCNNQIIANDVHDFAANMYDVGGIYTLSPQPGTVIRDNRIEHLLKAPYAHDPNHYQYIYLDEHSAHIRIQDNWTEKAKFFSNTPGPGNVWINNGPQVSADIKNKAGMEPNYKDLLNLDF